MFTEADLENKDKLQGENRGWIEVIAGCMFSGKTEELIRRVNRAVIARQKVSIFKPAIDTRYHLENVVSHNDNSLNSIPVSSADQILTSTNDSQVIAIDEIQFFDLSIVKVCNDLANLGKRVIVAGLDMDFEGKPFESTSGLMAISEYVSKLHAICVVCGANASYSYRLTTSDQKVLLGAKDHYEARCRECFRNKS